MRKYDHISHKLKQIGRLSVSKRFASFISLLEVISHHIYKGKLYFAHHTIVFVQI